MAILANTLTGANATAVTAANSGATGTAFDVVSASGDSALTYTTEQSHSGPSCMKLVTATTPPSTYGRHSSTQWSPSGPTLWGRCFIRVPASPGASTGFVTWSRVDVTTAFHLRVTSGRVLSVYNGASPSVSVAQSSQLPTNQWIRVEWRVQLGAGTGNQVEVRIFLDPESSTPSQTLSANTTTAEAVQYFFWGTTIGGTSSTIYIDDIGLSDTGWLGTLVGTLTSAAVGAPTAAGFVARYDTVAAASVRLAVSGEPGMTSPQYFGPSTPDSDGLGKISCSGLTADTDYYWQMEVDGQLAGSVGRVRTFPTPGEQGSFSFAAGSCATTNTNQSVFDSIRNMTGPGGRRAMFFAHLGDFHYDNRTAANDQALFLDCYRDAFAQPRQAQLHREIPVMYTWSDHDFNGSNVSGGFVSVPAVQAVYRKFFPHYSLADTGNKGIWQTWVVNRVRFIMTDGRSYASPNTDADGPSKTKLGAEQEAWFIDLLENSTEPVIVWLHEDGWSNGPHSGGDNVPQTFMGDPPTEANSDDTWEAYANARGRLMPYLAARNVLYTNGDFHSLAADDGTNTPGNLPVCVVSPLDQQSYTGNGVYSHGQYPEDDLIPGQRHFGWFDVQDNGSTITIDFSGYDQDNVERVSMVTTFSVDGSELPVTVWDGSNELAATLTVWDGTNEIPVTGLEVAP